jgi:hypothetical protein
MTSLRLSHMPFNDAQLLVEVHIDPFVLHDKSMHPLLYFIGEWDRI